MFSLGRGAAGFFAQIPDDETEAAFQRQSEQASLTKAAEPRMTSNAARPASEQVSGPVAAIRRVLRSTFESRKSTAGAAYYARRGDFRVGDLAPPK